MDVKTIREELGLTKYAFAKKLGVAWQTVHYWEVGAWEPNVSSRAKILKLGEERSE